MFSNSCWAVRHTGSYSGAKTHFLRKETSYVAFNAEFTRMFEGFRMCSSLLTKFVKAVLATLKITQCVRESRDVVAVI